MPGDLKEFIKTKVHPLLGPSAARAFHKRAAASTNLEDALDLTFGWRFYGIHIRPAQVRDEIARFVNVLAQLAPKTVLEIGTASGGSYFLFSRIATEDALLISVDLPGGRFGGGYASWRSPLYQSFARARQRVELLRSDSHSPDSLNSVKTLLDGRMVDLLFIDGDHSYAGAKQDFEMYSPLVRPGGVIGFHDIVPGPGVNVGGVPSLWKELSATAHGTEIVANWNQGGYGIGYLTK